MWKVWQWFDPRQYLAILFAFNFILALVIHFVLLSTPRYDWLKTGPNQKCIKFKNCDGEGPMSSRSAMPN